jgi:hypothetical protein
MVLNTYSKLEKLDYDLEVVEQFAQACEEAQALKMRLSYLNELMGGQDWAKQYVWRTEQGKYIPIRNLTDDHLINIIKHLNRGNRKIPATMQSEYNRRGLELAVAKNEDKAVSEGEIVDAGYGELPF